MEEAEEESKGKKGKKGKTPEPSVESNPVGHEEFVSQVLGYINSPSTAEEGAHVPFNTAVSAASSRLVCW